MSESATTTDYLDLTAEIVVAHVGHNAVTPDALPNLIEIVYRSLAATAAESSSASGSAEKPKPAVTVNRSVFPDYIVCLEDGKKLKMLKRHLRVSYGMTPDDYRKKWGLPANYPMVAHSYASRRSDLAKSIGLGRKSAAETAEPTVIKVPARRARGSRG